ncbi:porin [Cryomorpha ignava]|uniref:Porin n=1 Tax=Cryomorpha ignava TaxID=101383 RepID=A0A7K3WQI3_9FLAO|nr:porin [Cryomorpha ignava]NEN23920.1 porin [Cryomorpha ignava]
MKNLVSIFLFLLYCTCTAHVLRAQDSSDVKLSYGKKGFELATDDDNYKLQIQARFQFRYATPYDIDPVNHIQLMQPARQIAEINRARLKIGGNAYKPYLKYYFEYELKRGALLDFRVMFEKWDWLKFKVGQWKIEYTRERLISSGKQSLVDRSLINQYFTLDRQQGVTIYGNVGNHRLANFSYWAAVLTGSGRSATENPTNDLMYHARLQWNFCGKEMIMEGSDTEFHQKGIGAIALAGATYKGPYNLFSSNGGANIYNVPDSITPFYDVSQLNLETAYMKRGFAWQSETHLKIIDDQANNTTSNLAGTYFQAGYFFHQLFPKFPEKMEIAGRYTIFTPHIDTRDVIHNEYSLAVNYFFKNHLNKLTAEITRFEFDDPGFGVDGRYRFRVQWDISF